MTDTTQLPPLPTLQPGDSHMESLIEAAIQGHASTRDAMRWLVRQIVPQPAQATQAEVTDEQIKEAYLAWCKTNGTPESFARAILALRPVPVPVPMTDEQRRLAFLASRAGHGHTAFMLGISASEAHHGITAQAKKEDT